MGTKKNQNKDQEVYSSPCAWPAVMMRRMCIALQAGATGHRTYEILGTRERNRKQNKRGDGKPCNETEENWKRRK